MIAVPCRCLGFQLQARTRYQLIYYPGDACCHAPYQARVGWARAGNTSRYKHT